MLPGLVASTDLPLAESAKKHLIDASESYEAAKDAFKALTASHSNDQIQDWIQKEKEAKKRGGSSLQELYMAQINEAKGRTIL